VNEKDKFPNYIIIAFVMLFASGFITGFITSPLAVGRKSAAIADGNGNGTDGQYQYYIENERIITEVRNELNDCARELETVRSNSERTIDKIEQLRIIIKQMETYRLYFDRIERAVDNLRDSNNGD
jgi:hypothetical protein